MNCRLDCAHAWDYSPQDLKNSQERGHPFTIREDERYRTLTYVQQQCAHLAEQVANVALGAV